MGGAAIGDALGWPQEQNNRRVRESKHAPVSTKFRSWKRQAGGRFYAHEEIIGPGEYSDDTQLLLATARCLASGASWNRCFCTCELPLWLLYERGGGGATKRAADSWRNGIAPWLNPDLVQRYFEAGGNGAAMRIAPHALQQSVSLPILFRQIVCNGIATHGHPRGLVGALVYGYAVWLASRTHEALRYGLLIDQLLEERALWSPLPALGSEYDEWVRAAEKAFPHGLSTAWDAAVSEVIDGLERTRQALHRGALAIDRELLQQLGAFDVARNGAGTTTALVAIYLASRFAADPVTGLLEAAFIGQTDSDTYASMTGGLLGAIHGTDWILPEWQAVQDSAYLSSIARSLTADPLPVKVMEPLKPWNKQAASALFKALEQPNNRGADIGHLGIATTLEVIRHVPLAKSAKATTWKVATAVGQTLFIRKVERVVEQEPPRSAPPPQAMLQESPRTSLLALMHDLAQNLPPQIPAATAFEALGIVLQELERVRKELPDPTLPSGGDLDGSLLSLLNRHPVLGKSMSVRDFRRIVRTLSAYLQSS